MSNKNIGDIIDVTESLEDGLKLDIKNVSKIEKDKTGDFIIISTADGKKYRTYSSIIIEALGKVQAKKFDFTKDVLKCQVKATVSADGNEYFTLVSQK
jgi:kynurenine formamidase